MHVNLFNKESKTNMFMNVNYLGFTFPKKNCDDKKKWKLLLTGPCMVRIILM
jgi:hypothetical protein